MSAMVVRIKSDMKTHLRLALFILFTTSGCIGVQASMSTSGLSWNSREALVDYRQTDSFVRRLSLFDFVSGDCSSWQYVSNSNLVTLSYRVCDSDSSEGGNYRWGSVEFKWDNDNDKDKKAIWSLSVNCPGEDTFEARDRTTVVTGKTKGDIQTAYRCPGSRSSKFRPTVNNVSMSSPVTPYNKPD